MGREIKRVPLDFDWPLKEVWSGFLMPDSLSEERCKPCGGSGYSAYARHLQSRWYGYVPFDPAETGSTPLKCDTPTVLSFAERNVTRSPEYYGPGTSAIMREADRLAALWNGQWSHHLHQDDVDALLAADRLWDLTRTCKKGEGWKPIEPTPTVTAEQVNLWSIGGFGHDGINCSVVIRAACERADEDVLCGFCGGDGSTEKYAGQRADAEAWERTGPPVGDGWQLWETTSEGSPTSPVFATDEELAQWMSRNPCGFGNSTISLEAARKFVGDGWAPSMVSTPETGLLDGITGSLAMAPGSAE